MEIEKKGYWYEYPRPAITTDSVIFGFDGTLLNVLLIERGAEPFKGMWALPGGFMRMDESIEECAARELAEETNVKDVYLEEFGIFSKIDRDPRGRVVTVAFIALVRPSDYQVIGGDDAARAAWFDLNMLPPLAFDHLDIINVAREKLREILKVRPVAFRLLEEVFSVDDLRKVFEAVNGTVYDRRNFQRKLMQWNGIEEVNIRHLSEERDSRSFLCCDSLPDSSGHPICRPERNSTRPGRKISKLFRLRRNNLTDNQEDFASDRDSSIKDLFNY